MQENISFQHLFNTIAEGFGKKGPHREATPFLGQVAWRMASLKSLLTGKQSILTRETAQMANSLTKFDNRALLKALPHFSYSPLNEIIKCACKKFEEALEKGQLTL
jgi:hypothetical protein